MTRIAAPSAASASGQSAAGIGVREAAAHRAAIAHRAVGDMSRHLARAARSRRAAGPRARRASPRRRCARRPPRLRSAVSDSMRETSTSSFGRARRRFSIGPSDWPPAMRFRVARASREQLHRFARRRSAARSRTRPAFMRPPASVRLSRSCPLDRLEQLLRRERRRRAPRRRAARARRSPR